MTHVRTARVVYHVYSPRVTAIPAREVEAARDGHPVPEGVLEVRLVERQDVRFASYQLEPRVYQPSLTFEHFAQIWRARRVYVVEALESEPEDLGYLRAAMLVAAELAALSGGIMVDLLGRRVTSPEEVARQIDRRFDPMDHLSVQVEARERPLWVGTYGMRKFAHADFELVGVPIHSQEVAIQLLRHLAAAVVAGGSFRPGEATELCGFEFRFEPCPEPTPGDERSALVLRQFRLLRDNPSAAMQGMLACSR